MKKRGVFFSTDALIALMIIFVSVLIIYPVVKYAPEKNYIQEDILNVLSSLKIDEIEEVYVEGNITNLNNSVMEQIGEFYVTDLSAARVLASFVLENIDARENVGIWYGNKLLASRNVSSYEESEDVTVARRVISGIREGESVTGFSSRAFLKSNVRTKYFYFGGYVGEGNISIKVDYEGDLNNVDLEVAANTNFSICVNGGACYGYLEPADSYFEPKKFSSLDLPLVSGSNVVKFVPANPDEELFIAGGYLKINYDDGDYFEIYSDRYYFPGIEGLINLYDGFYVPEVLTGMNIFLHYKSPYVMFLNIGNVTVFNDSSEDETTFEISNAELENLEGFDYDFLSQKTIPLRLGLESASYVSDGRDADVFSVTDLSGSMDDDLSCSGGDSECCERCFLWFCWDSCEGDMDLCESCGGTLSGKIISAIEANNLFIDAVLNNSNNLVGLSSYAGDVLSGHSHNLSNDDVSLKNKVSGWEAGGSTCICCGINDAVQNLLDDSSEDKFRSMVVMSDGEANVECDEQGWTEDLNLNGDTDDAGDDAIQAACDAYENYGITVYSIGFGSGVDEDTLEGIASCGNGTYNYSSTTQLEEVYQQIAEEIIEASYSEQTIEVTGDFENTYLYPDSYIEFDYVGSSLPYGLIISGEEQFSDNYFGNFNIPEDSEKLSANVVSYSGSRWTDEVSINNISVYNLDVYNSDYVELGDPYHVDIPMGLINDTNSIKLTTGYSFDNSTEGSVYNKIIYQVVKNVTSYSPISSSAEGCKWFLDFEEVSNLTFYVPSDYDEENFCNYQEGNIQYDENDAIQRAVFYLLEELDFDGDGKLDVQFSEQDLDISSSEIVGIPFGWSTEVQVRKWH
ncbi:VWA domain-containing protein [archaeon]|jgi:hypothetical protein|nr:VWA domain-containing protein [archaeon]